MASCTTSTWGNSYSPRVTLNVSVSSNGGATATLSWSLVYSASYAAYSSAAKSYSVVIDGSTVKSGSYSIGGKTGSHTIASGTKTVNKSTSARTVSFSCSFGFNLTWNGSYSGTRSASGSLSISAKSSYTVSYNANGGSGAPGNQTKWWGTNLTLSSTKPTRTYYAFKGWATSASGGVSYAPGATYSTNAPLTLYAVWQGNTYSVSYDANGGTGAPAKQTYTYGGSNINLSSTIPTRTNYNFLGWSRSQTATEAEYSAGQAWGSTNAGDYILYAVWEIAFIPPRITEFSVNRCDASGTIDDEGTNAIVKFNWVSDDPISSIKIEWKQSSELTYPSGNVMNVPASGTFGSVNQIVGNNAISTDYNYDIRITVADINISNTSTLSISSMFFIMDIYKTGNGVAFGKPSIKDGFEVGMDATFLNPAMFNAGLKEKLPVIRNADFNTITESGKYYLINPPTNSPIAKSGYLEVMRYENDTSFIYQRFTTYDGNKFERVCVSGTWEQWCGTFMKGIWTYTTQVNGLFEAWGTKELGAHSSYSNAQIGNPTELSLYYHSEPLPIKLYKTGTYIKQAQVASGTTYMATGGLNDTTTQIGSHWAALPKSGTCSVRYYVKGYWKKPTIPMVT